MHPLRSFFASIAPLSAEAWALAEGRFHREVLPAQTHLIREGQVCQRLSFVTRGLLRLYYQRDGAERIMLFFREGSVAGDYFSFLTQTPSLRPVQTLEETELYHLGYADLQALYRHPDWSTIGRKLNEQAYLFAVQRANRLIHDEPETRYHQFCQEQPELIQRVPQYMIASYLDMEPETLSRIKRRLQQNPSGPAASIHPDPPPGAIQG